MTLSERERTLRLKLRDDFPVYAKACLKIRPKAGGIIPFVLNDVQRIVHETAERLLRERGEVRILVLKARQPGISTYVEGRFYWKVSHRKGVRAFILTHSDVATGNLFSIAKRYHDYCPDLVKPELKASNARELDFGVLDSGYRVGTAKAEGVGRSDTIQFFHGSEVAFWANAEEHASGALEAIPKSSGTEVWLESTAQGVGGYFYNMWQAAERGENDYYPLFIPWFALAEYSTPAPEDWLMPAVWQEYAEGFDLTRDQLYWAWTKNAGMSAAEGTPPDEICWRFRQEYPSTAIEAFRTSRGDTFIQPVHVRRARNFTAPEQNHAPLILGCDFARGERDWNWFISRRGRLAGEINERFHSSDTVDIASRLAKLIDQYNPHHCFLDTGGGGSAVYDILCSRNYEDYLSLINFGWSARDQRKYSRRRSEMWGGMRDWFMDPGGCEIPDDDVLEGELTAPGSKENANQQVQLESKEDIRKRLGFSPDGGDALALTFAEDVGVRMEGLGHRNLPTNTDSNYDIMRH